MNIAAVILSYNSLATFRLVLEAVNRQTRPPQWIVVVDNHSSDGTREFLAENAIADEVVLLSENLGVGAGHNVGWKRALELWDCDYIWALEHDSVPRPKCLESLENAGKALLAGQRLGAVKPIQELPQKTGVLESAELGRGVSLPSRVELIDKLDFNGTLIAAEAIQTIGLLREDFFVGQEDREYAKRMSGAGYTIVRVADAVVEHRNKGLRSRGIHPSVLRAYYSTRNATFLETYERRTFPRVMWALAKSVAGTLKIALGSYDKKRDRIRARWAATRDGLSGNLGVAKHSFLT